jgi:hypothetical protein
MGTDVHTSGICLPARKDRRGMNAEGVWHQVQGRAGGQPLVGFLWFWVFFLEGACLQDTAKGQDVCGLREGKVRLEEVQNQEIH